MYALLSVGADSDNFASVFLNFFNFAKAAFLDFSPKDAIDILLLTVVFFFCYRFLKQKQAGMVILGIIVCLAVLILSIVLIYRASDLCCPEFSRLALLPW